MNRNSGLRRFVSMVLVLLMVLACLQAQSAVAAAPTGAGCPRAASTLGTNPSSGQSATARPVVYVHGWRGTEASLHDMATAVSDEMGAGSVSTFLFDYGSYSTTWAAQSEIAACLGQYINDASAAYRRAGGDGKVLAVAHSMGGYALLYSADPAFAQKADSSVLAGLVTLDTPYLGSPFGNTDAAGVVGKVSEILPFSKIGFPEPGTDAGRCLATHRKGAGLPSGCGDLPSSLPSNVRLTEITGNIRVERRLLGHTWYTIDLGTDGIVPAASGSGYLEMSRSIPKFDTAPELERVDCTITSDVVGTAVKTLQITKNAWAAALEPAAQTLLDSNTADGVLGAHLTVGVVTYDAAALFTAPCSHINITNPEMNPHVVDLVASSLRNDIKALDKGKWTEKTVIITGSSLGAVTRGMPLTLASDRAGISITPSGDGVYVSRVPGLAIIGAEPGARCFTVNSYSPGGPLVVTRERFALGEGVEDLQRIYGNQLQYTPGIVSSGGYYAPGTRLGAGYWITDNEGYLLFQTRDDSKAGAITGIISAPNAPPSINCGPT